MACFTPFNLMAVRCKNHSSREEWFFFVGMVLRQPGVPRAPHGTAFTVFSGVLLWVLSGPIVNGIELINLFFVTVLKKCDLHHISYAF